MSTENTPCFYDIFNNNKEINSTLDLSCNNGKIYYRITRNEGLLSLENANFISKYMVLDKILSNKDIAVYIGSFQTSPNTKKFRLECKQTTSNSCKHGIRSYCILYIDEERRTNVYIVH